jgi:hypothetical protein
MAQPRNVSQEDEPMPTTPITRRRRRASRSGSATGSVQNFPKTNWTPEQRKYYALGAKHAAEILEIQGVTLPSGMLFTVRT